MLIKRSISLSGHRTSIALEPEFWAALEKLSTRHNMTLAAFIQRIDAERAHVQPLASSLRVCALLGTSLLPVSNEG